jgi:hypothetical protein
VLQTNLLANSPQEPPGQFEANAVQSQAGASRSAGSWPGVAAGVYPAPRRAKATLLEQYAILVTCRDEAQQVELLARFDADGLDCRALLS